MIYPNPSSNYINIVNAENLESVKVYNTNGQILIESIRTRIDVSKLPPSVYFVDIRTKNKTVTKKIIIQ